MAQWTEPDYKFAFKRNLLNILLDKYEDSDSFRSGQLSNRRPQVSLTDRMFKDDYNDEMDFRKREWSNQVILSLVQDGLVDVKWTLFRENQQGEKVWLNPDRLLDAYRKVDRIPLIVKLENLREVLTPLEDHPWLDIRTWWIEINQLLLDRRKASLGNDLDSIEETSDLVKALLALPNINEPILKRTWSLNLYRDSKHFEQRIEKRLVNIIRKLRTMEDASDESVLDALGIMYVPKPVYLQGSMNIQLSDGYIDTSLFSGGLALFPETISSIKGIELHVKEVVTIENLTSYHQWIRQRKEKEELVIYTGGYPNKTVQRLFDLLANEGVGRSGGIPLFHWGDIDLGGLRIAMYLQEKWFPFLCTWKMDRSTLMKYSSSAVPMSEEYKTKVRKAIELVSMHPMKEVLIGMLEYNLRLEQESIDPSIEVK